MHKQRSGYIRQSSMPAQRLGRRANTKIYMLRRVVFIIAIVLTLAFIGKTVLSFFSAEYVSLELSGNMHYTDLQIYDALGEQLQNIVTDSEEQTANYLKENLSYIKEARINKHVMKRLLTIEITERDPFAILRFDTTADASVDRNSSFFLVDNGGHVLKHIDKQEIGPLIPEQFREMVVIQTRVDEIPQVGDAIKRSEVILGLEVLKTALFRERELATQIKSIDASDSRKIKLQLDAFPVPVWLAADTIALGLHHIALFLKHRKTEVLKLIQDSSVEVEPYLDARFQDTVYLGGLVENE
ncbi:FtsQ-type POTRA domain-containing protein [Candidatus Poribacteria bacterium]|nr:FtsQ-type POTRA domain-containing protein [Candidatus Poribacteria bacterium]